jgi:hypothetical protein
MYAIFYLWQLFMLVWQNKIMVVRIDLYDHSYMWYIMAKFYDFESFAIVEA